MKNPLKGLGDKLKNLRDKFVSARKPESAKAVVDGIGDSSIIGGIALVGTAAFLPAAPVTVLVAGGLFIAAGATAKYAASKMKPDVYDVTNPPPIQSGARTGNENASAKSSLKAKGPAPEFKNAVDNKQASPAEKPAAKPGIVSPQP